MIEQLISKIYLLEKRRQFSDFEPVFPKQIDLESTNICNLRCPICPQPTQSRKEGLLKFDLARKIIDEISRYGLEKMCLSLFGEPFLNKEFFEISRYAASFGKINYLYISTNGLLIDHNVGEQLLTSGLDKIIVSIDGICQSTYEKIRVGGDYNKAVDNVTEFIKLRRRNNKTKPAVAVQIIRMDETRDEINDFVRFWKSRIDSYDSIDIKEYFTWAHKVEDKGVRDRHEMQIKVPCFTYLWSNMAVHWNGDMSVCCYDANGDLIVGNATEDSIYNVWHSERYHALRLAHLNGFVKNIPVCINCELSHRRFTRRELWNAVQRRLIRRG